MPGATTAAAAAAAAAAAVAAAPGDFYRLLPRREVVVGSQPLGSRLQLALDPALACELQARREVAALRRRRAALVAAELELERRAALQRCTAHAAAAAAVAAPRAPGAPALGLQPLSPDDRAAQRWRHARLEAEWAEERRRRLGAITRHALPEARRPASPPLAISPRPRQQQQQNQQQSGPRQPPQQPLWRDDCTRPAQEAAGVREPRGKARSQQPQRHTPSDSCSDGHPSNSGGGSSGGSSSDESRRRPRTAPAAQQLGPAANSAGNGCSCSGGCGDGAALWVWRRDGALTMPPHDGLARGPATGGCGDDGGAPCCEMCRSALRHASPERALEGLRARASPVRAALGEALAEARTRLHDARGAEAAAARSAGAAAAAARREALRRDAAGGRGGAAAAAKREEVAGMLRVLRDARDKLAAQEARHRRKLLQLQGAEAGGPEAEAEAARRRRRPGSAGNAGVGVAAASARPVWIP
ncbi:hypothetical protein Rsub_04766 [Raphidocelis subcapitata]|uniref:Uncharacterized protein n=1 Tax=Raphidocelis subcapitata TaxID=307507 RepID=A0A2V0P1M5_9CHLO|nr:hypothetical protein Rsub_04766 [Raphidocelis subcapitata]|eukprot:GBF91097.1 hypothetical protein Rsub_04766 [Raphidocelis subcapitata]